MTRKLGNLFIVAVFFIAGVAVARESASAAEPEQFNITEYGATGDGTKLNTKAIQTAIDQCAAAGGGTVVVPKGEFLTGSLFLKPGVNLELLEQAVLKGSSNIEDYELKPNTRFEGHFAEWRAGLLNAEHTDHLRITGPGMLDGNGAAYWSAKAPNGRPRLCAIRDSTDVIVSGVHFMRSASWNLHFYNCKDVTVENSRMEILDADKGPATDGTDIDSCQNVTIRDCFYSVNDDCVALKGNRYDGLDQEPASPPVANVHITNCTFQRGMGALTLGSEATKIHDVEMDHCTVSGNVPMLRFKMRSDTPGQDYQNVSVHDITLDGRGLILSFEPAHGTKAAPRPPRAVIRNISVSDITGTYGSLGKIAPNPNTDISDVALKNFNVKVRNAQLSAGGVSGLTFENVIVNDVPMAAAGTPTNP